MPLTRRQVLAAAGAGGTLAVVASPVAPASTGGRVATADTTSLPAATTVTSDDQLVGLNGSVTKRFDLDLVAEYVRQVVRTLGNDDTDPAYPLNVQLDYRKTDIATPTAIGMVGSHTTVNYGSQTVPVAAAGSVLASETSMIVRNGAQAGSEQCASFAVLRYDQDGVNGGTPGRGWLADWTVHGAITQQQEILTGLNLVVGNYYDGQPSESPSVGIALAAGNSIGGSLDAAHAAATRYPNGVGLMVVGSVNGGTGRGWNTAIQIGGSGSGWNVTKSKVGYGVDARDYDMAGIRLHNRSGSAAGIIIEDTGGSLVVGKSAAVSSVMTIAGTFVAPAADPASAMVSFLTNDPQSIGRGASIGFGGNTTDAAGTPRNFAVIAGRKANATSGDTSGYMAFYTNKSGVGFAERMRISEDGDLRLLANFMEWDEIADAAAPATNKARLYARDNGAGKTQLVVRFPTGAVQVLATEP